MFYLYIINCLRICFLHIFFPLHFPSFTLHTTLHAWSAITVGWKWKKKITLHYPYHEPTTTVYRPTFKLLYLSPYSNRVFSSSYILHLVHCTVLYLPTARLTTFPARTALLCKRKEVYLSYIIYKSMALWKISSLYLILKWVFITVSHLTKLI